MFSELDICRPGSLYITHHSKCADLMAAVRAPMNSRPYRRTIMVAYMIETMSDPAHRLMLFQRVISVSMETMKIVRLLPSLGVFA